VHERVHVARFGVVGRDERERLSRLAVRTLARAREELDDALALGRRRLAHETVTSMMRASARLVVVDGARARRGRWRASSSTSRLTPTSRRDATRAPRRGDSTAAAASKSSKNGRFPATPPAEDRAAVRERAAGEMTSTSTSVVDAALASWGVSSETVAERARRLWPDAFADDADARVLNAREGARIILTHKNENLYNAYACEMAAMTSPPARAMCVGMFYAAGGARDARRAAGARAEIAPVAVAATAEELLEEISKLRVRVDAAVSFVHECVARHPTRMSSDETARRFRAVVATFGARGLNDSKNERETDEVIRFVTVESAEGYAFGLVTYAPSSLSLRAVDWARKPRHFSAGTRAEIALACVNVAVADDPDAYDVTDGACVVVDPCCGSGTMIHAAWSRGVAVAGGDVSPGAVVMSKQNVGHFVSRAASDRGSMPSILERDALTPGAFDDGYGSRRRVRAIVSNLPFGRRVAIGGGDGDGRNAPGASASEYAPLLKAFRDVAERHVYVSGVPIAEEMRRLGYVNVTEVSLCRFGRSFMTTATGKTASAALAPDVAFTVEDALANAAGKKEKRWGKKTKMNVDLDARFNDPNALRVAVDVSYEQDSARARRSVAKQLCECVGVAHREYALAMTYCAFDGPIAEESREFFFSDRWASVKTDSRRVEEAFDRERVVYMSPDASDVLDEVTSDKVYVVGGIVDLATRGMRTSLTSASAREFRCARLPIREYRPEQTHSVLNIDAVVKILAGRHRGESWDDVFERELPKRQAVERPKREKRERRAETE